MGLKELARAGADAEGVAAELEELRRRAETEALQKADDVLRQAEAAHASDAAGYRIECRRWGDFLSLFIERGGRKLVEAVNLGRTTSLRLGLGALPNRDGVLEYSVSMDSDSGRSWGGVPNRPAPKGYRYNVYAAYPSFNWERPMYRVDDPPSDRGSLYFNSHESDRLARTTNYPQAAKDDHIRFAGIGGTLYTPAGIGRGVLDAILREIAAGTPPVALPTEQEPAPQS